MSWLKVGHTSSRYADGSEQCGKKTWEYPALSILDFLLSLHVLIENIYTADPVRRLYPSAVISRPISYKTHRKF